MGMGCCRGESEDEDVEYEFESEAVKAEKTRVGWKLLVAAMLACCCGKVAVGHNDTPEEGHVDLITTPEAAPQRTIAALRARPATAMMHSNRCSTT
jgi:hypothetical protein